MAIAQKPELMSPAGHWPEMHAAIEAGADAVYFGLKHFTARAKVGFTLDELPDAMARLHERGVKGFVTFNTLVFDHEIELAWKALEQVADSNVDAVIVQDVGVANWIRQNLPGLEVHGSTQMSVTSAEGAEWARALGCSRIVLGRELSLRDIRKISEQTDIELEVFVHGALCVSYSGQCFSSEAWGGRSANRGQCAQACRLAYDLIVDGQRRDLGEYRYLLSPGDLYALEQVPELMEIGVACLKIEGRYKNAEYVALTTKAYRAAIDSAAEKVELENSTELRNQLEQVYSRGLGSHFISGIDHQKVVDGRAPRHRGRKAGQVERVRNESVVVSTEIGLNPGDGVVFDAAHRRSPDLPEEGGFIYDVAKHSDGKVEITFAHGQIDFGRIEAGDWLWRTHDPQLNKLVKPLLKSQQPVFTRPVDFQVEAKVGKPLKVLATSDTSICAEFLSDDPLSQAQNLPVNKLQLEQQLGRLGGTAFHLGKVTLDTDSLAFAPVSLLNRARRQLVESLLFQRKQAKSYAAPEIGSIAVPVHVQVEVVERPQMHLLVRNEEQLGAALALDPASITLDYLELYGLRKSVQRIQETDIVARVASPRILKPSEEKIIRFLLSLGTELVVRSTGLLYQLSRRDPSTVPGLIGDFSLNVANQLSCKRMFELGVRRVTPTHDLNAMQVNELAAATEPSRIEVIAFHHLPVFHTEHCVFCRFLSDGTDSTNCGHPCEKHRIALEDGQGRKHPVMADVGCRNTVFGAESQFASKHLDDWISSGIKHFRLEFVHETAEQVEGVGNAMSEFLRGSIDSDKLRQRVGKWAPNGTTDGSFYVPDDFKKLVQLQ